MRRSEFGAPLAPNAAAAPHWPRSPDRGPFFGSYGERGPQRRLSWNLPPPWALVSVTLWLLPRSTT